MRIVLSGIAMLLIIGCHGSLTYTAAELEAFQGKELVIELRYRTRAGEQCSFYIAPKRDSSAVPSPLVIVYPGIISCAADWVAFAAGAPDSEAGFVLIDYPGRGKNGGIMRPRYLYESSAGAVSALAAHLDLKEERLTGDLKLLGHSFGGGAALQYATRTTPTRIVLVATFTTMHRLLATRFGPLAWFIPDGLDNEAALKLLSQRSQRPDVVIIHGSDDTSVPVAMGRALAGLYPDWIVYHELEGQDHTRLLKEADMLIYESLFAGE